MKLDKQVLRFQGFFKDSVTESRLENHKIRLVTIYYYLEDNTIMLNEPRQENAGTPQGVFLKRQMVLRNDGSAKPISCQDFHIGQDTHIYGREIRIYDADQYTREFFEVSAALLTSAECWCASRRSLGYSCGCLRGEQGPQEGRPRR